MNNLDVGIKRLNMIKELDINAYEVPYKLHCDIHNIDPCDSNERKTYDVSLIDAYSNMSEEAFQGYVSMVKSNNNTDISDESKTKVVRTFKKALEKNL